MTDEYGSDFITMTDEDGNEFELEHLDTLEYKGETYMAFIEADSDENADDEGDGLIILKAVEENGEELLSTLDSEEELETVYELFMKRVFDFEEDGIQE